MIFNAIVWTVLLGGLAYLTYDAIRDLVDEMRESR